MPLLTLIGADEFLPDRQMLPRKNEGKVKPDIVREVYNRCNIDAGYLSPVASQWFQTPPQKFFLIHKEPFIKQIPVTLTDGQKINVLLTFFPALPSSDDEAIMAKNRHNLISQILDRTIKTKNQLKNLLVIGISPWGFQNEAEALPQLASVFHILLGAGSGAPIVADAPEHAPTILWSRSDIDGKGLIVLDILKLPLVTEPWNPMQSAWAHEIPLVAPLPEDPEIEKLLH